MPPEQVQALLAIATAELAATAERAAGMYEEFCAERRMLRDALVEYGETDERLSVRYAALKGRLPA